MGLETRALPGAEIRSYDDQEHSFRAKILSYNRSDSYGSVWSPGCFNESLKQRTPAACWNHDMSRPIGRVVDYSDDSDGLEVTVKLADLDAVPDARMAHSLLSDGVCDGFSVGFQRSKVLAIPPSQRSEFGDYPAKERMVSAHLGEVSAVLAPSVPGTALLAIRSDGKTGDGEPWGPDEAMIQQWLQADLITREEARSLLVRAVPLLREHITLGGETPDETRDDPAPDASSDYSSDGDDEDDVDSAESWAAATDAALDEAVRELSKVEWPADAQRAMQLVNVAGGTVDNLLRVMGIDDPDDPVEDSDNGGRDEDLEQRVAVSDKPWGDFSESDYSDSQYANACVLDRGASVTAAKERYGLPITEPDGTLNSNGVHAAASALAGGRGGVKASPEQKAAAAKKIIGAYNKMGEKPTPALLRLAGGNAAPSGRSVETVFAKHHVA